MVTAMPLFKTYELESGVRLVVHSTTKLKTLVVKVYFQGDLDGNVTSRTLIPLVLRRGTRRFADSELPAQSRCVAAAKQSMKAKLAAEFFDGSRRGAEYAGFQLLFSDRIVQSLR